MIFNATMARKRVSILLATSIVIACAILSLEPELRLAVPLLVGVTAAITIALTCILYFGERNTLSWSPAVILAVALLLRLLFLFSPPQLSDDIYRYLWDGSNLLRGTNPYRNGRTLSPAAVAFANMLRQVKWQ